MTAIRATCAEETELPRAQLDELVPFQRDLKELREDEYEALKRGLQEHGLLTPFAVWRTPGGVLNILDGHQRHRVLQREGWTVDGGGVPYVAVSAATAQEAAAKLLHIVGQYARIDKQGLYEFAAHFELDLPGMDALALPDVDWNLFKVEFYNDKGYDPNVNPTIGRHQVTAGELAQSHNDLQTQHQKVQTLHEVTCPHCGRDFYIDE